MKRLSVFLFRVAWKFALLLLLWPVFKYLHLFGPLVSVINRREMGNPPFFEYFTTVLANPDRFIEPNAFYVFNGFLLVVVVLTEFAAKSKSGNP